jgi:hypothetical protein
MEPFFLLFSIDKTVGSVTSQLKMLSCKKNLSCFFLARIFAKKRLNYSILRDLRDAIEIFESHFDISLFSTCQQTNFKMNCIDQQNASKPKSDDPKPPVSQTMQQ